MSLALLTIARYVCMCIYTRIHVRTYMYTRTHVACIRIYTRIRIRDVHAAYTRIGIHAHGSLRIGRESVYTRVGMHAYI